LSLSWFQFFKGALSAEQVQNLSDDTISRGTSVPTFPGGTTMSLRRGKKDTRAYFSEYSNTVCIMCSITNAVR